MKIIIDVVECKSATVEVEVDDPYLVLEEVAKLDKAGKVSWSTPLLQRTN